MITEVRRSIITSQKLLPLKERPVDRGKVRGLFYSTAGGGISPKQIVC